jgi:hypothetical protein
MGFIVAIANRIGVGLGGIVAAAAVSLAAVPAASADTINVVQKTRYWLDNSVYYEYGPLRDADHCIAFAHSNARFEEYWNAREAHCTSPGLGGQPWYFQAPINIL